MAMTSARAAAPITASAATPSSRSGVMRLLGHSTPRSPPSVGVGRHDLARVSGPPRMWERGRANTEPVEPVLAAPAQRAQ